ncbi:hypothetical protein KKH23_04900 [Patescibacteria group bacterium]|nr:hypothetical protein [Patescibacteria group bacterium]MBU1067259.1 hypothetical protein [Patescibacteria group bacterium]
MAASVHVDPTGFGDMEATSRAGALNYLKRYLLVEGLEQTDQDKITEVLNAIDAAGYSAWHSYTPSTSALNNLVCASQHIRIMASEGKPTSALVTLEYSARGEADVDRLISVDGSLRQITSQKDGNGLDLSVSYTFPEGYPYNPALAGRTHTQGAEINVLFPNMVIRGVRYLQRTNPLITIARCLDCVNSKTWLGAAPGTVLCTNVQARMHDYHTSPRTWKFVFEFLYDGSEGGHQPDVVFRDPNTGLPPDDLIPGVGYYTATWYPSVDFGQESMFPSV